MRAPLLAAGLLAVCLPLGPPPLAGQPPPDLLAEGPDGTVARIPVRSPGGVASLDARSLELLGWAVRDEGDVVRASSPGTGELILRPGSPWVRWDQEVLQLASPPVREEGALRIPLQMAVDLLPRVLPRVYRWEPDRGTLRVLDETVWAARARPPGTAGRVVVIDPGHGGDDPGASGRRGLREKEVALGIGRALAEELRGDPDLEVYLTREDDVLVPLWERGELATAWKGDRPGVFVSLHVNALTRPRSTRGFETYFLSEARTEHERRVAANENAPLRLERSEDDPLEEDPDLSFILKELRNLDHQHWSALLAELVQEELARVHPGPDRGVKQAPLAVITNALMPAVLVELGFISNPEEERLLGRTAFQERAAGALADAVRGFFRRYPPGAEEPVGGGR